MIRLTGGGRDVAPRIDLLAPCILLTRRVAERFGHVADCRTCPIGDHVGNLGGVVAAVALVHVLDDLFSPVALDVDVDVGRAITLRRQEPLEQQPERHGVGLGDAQGVAHRAVGCAAAPLAEDVGPIAELDEIPHHQEVAGEPEMFDDVEFVVDGAPGPGPQRQVFMCSRPLAIATAATLLDEAAQVLHLAERNAGRTLRTRTWERRQVGRHQRQIERSRSPDLGSRLDHAGVTQEPPGLLGSAAQMGTGRCRQPRIELVEAAPRPHGGDCRGQPALRRRGVVHVVRRDTREVVTGRQLGQGIVARRVERVAVVPQLDDDAVATEQFDETAELLGCGSGTMVDEGRRHRALATAGEHPAVTGHRVGDVEQRELRCALLAGEMAQAQRAGQAGVPGGAIGKHQQMVTVRIRCV